MTAVATSWQPALDRNVRANPAYRLLAIDALDAANRRSLENAGVDLQSVFGLLVATSGSGLANKVVNATGAELFAARAAPGRAPREAVPELAGLVLDGVLEVELDDGFVSGPSAYDAVAEPTERDAPVNRLGRLSYAALRYAERLRLDEVDRLTARLYFYNRVPLSRRWARAYPNPEAVADLLSCPALSRDWAGGLPGDGRALDWLSWTRRDDPLLGRPDDLPYKLYVSPAVDALPDVLPGLVDVLTSAGARRFKVGPDASGLLRPDKIVVYMTAANEVERVARAVAAAFDGVAAHGVPFTAELAGGGLLSWGGDPPRDAGPVGGSVESWRLSVSRRLAEYLTAAQAAPLRRSCPADFALARLGIDGVDVRTFAPSALEAPASFDPTAVGR